MSVTKKISGNYTISTSTNWLANITLNTHTVFVNGNLLVGGTSTSIQKIDMEVSDNAIMLNKGELGAGVSLGTAGVIIDRGSLNGSAIFWDESVLKWRINDGTTTSNISISTGTGGIAVIDDPAPQLGGPLDTLDQYIFSSNTQQVKIDSNLAMFVQSVDPSAISSYNLLYAKAPDAGGTGVFQKSLSNSDELVSRNRALVFSLVL